MHPQKKKKKKIAGDKGCRPESKTTRNELFCYRLPNEGNPKHFQVQSTGPVQTDMGQDKLVMHGSNPFAVLHALCGAGLCPMLLQKVQLKGDSPVKLWCGHTYNHSKFMVATALTFETL